MTTEVITQAKNEIIPIGEKVKELVVKDDESRECAAVLRKDLKKKMEQIEAKYHFKENTKKANELHKANKATENSVYDPAYALDKAIVLKVKEYDRALALKVQKKAEENKPKRKEAERKEREKLEARAEKAEEKGKPEQAEAFREQAETVTVAPSFSPPPKSVKKLVTKAKVTNVMKLCKLIVDGEIPFTVVDVNQPQLNAWAKGQDVKTKYEGIELYQDTSGRI